METDLEFVRKVREGRFGLGPNADFDRLLHGYETAALIVEHRMDLFPMDTSDGWVVGTSLQNCDFAEECLTLDTAVRAVAQKLGKGK